MVSLQAAVADAIANPFGAGPSAPGATHPALLQPAPTLQRLLARGCVVDAERLVLAAGCVAARARSDAPVLDAKLLPARSLRALPRRRGDYVRVVAAGLRCEAALARLHGASEMMAALRANVWTACFGESLFDALHLEAVIVDHDLLLHGETGTGKELVAAAVLGARPGRQDGTPAPAAAINAAAVPETLIGSELFGHVRGAFTGAAQDRLGRIRGADGGCLFLDEVGDLPATTQVQLLRVMETDMVQPVGSDRSHPAQVRYVTATHRDLRAMVEAGEFRRDLFHRIADQVISLPPLRAHPEDIPEIGLAYVDAALPGEALPGTRERVEAFLHDPALRRHPFSGNVRELQNMVRGVMLGRQPALTAAVPVVDTHAGGQAAAGLPTAIAEHRASLHEVEQWYMRGVLAQHGGNVSRAARALGVDRSTVARRLAPE